MAVLNIRNLPDKVHARLRVSAARAGRSMEAEARAIIQAAVSEPEEQATPRHGDGFRQLKALVDRLYGEHKPKHVVDGLIAERRREAERE